MPSTGLFLAQSDTGGWIAIVLILVLAVFMIASMWVLYEKASQPGWGSIVPIYNMILLLNIANKPLWWIILMFLPLLSLIPGILVPLAIAKNFGKGVGFGVGLIFLPVIFYPLLAFGPAEYNPQV